MASVELIKVRADDRYEVRVDDEVMLVFQVAEQGMGPVGLLAGGETRKSPVVTLEEMDSQAIITVTRSAKGSKLLPMMVVGILAADDAIPCFVGEGIPDQRCLHVTSSRPESEFLNGLYSPAQDIAISLDAGHHRVSVFDELAKFSLADHQTARVTISLNHFKRHINPFYKPMDRERFPRPPVGWLSWYCYYCDFDEAKTLAITDFAVEHFKKYGFEYVQLETWEKNSDRLPVCLYYNSLEWDEAKFPHGMKWISDQIHERGLKSGLWIVPLGTGEEKDYLENKEIFLQNDEGGPVESWSGLYSIDPTHPKAKERIFETLRTVVHDWGYDYVKVDGLELGGTYGDLMFTLPEVVKNFHTREEDPLRDVGEIIRRAIGDDTFFLSCMGNPRKIGKFYGLANGSRVGHDVFYEGDDLDWGPVLKVAHVIQRSLHVHNIAWFNDPDVLCVRSDLPDSMATILMTMYGIAGQLLFLGDILYEIPEHRIPMLTKLMPVENVFPGQIPSADPDCSPSTGPAPWATETLKDIWVLHIGRDFEQWEVAALFNWDEAKKTTIELSAEGIGLSPDKSYLLYDFWNDKFLGTFRKHKKFTLPKQSCLLLGIREKQRHPQILSTNRHITQGGVDLVDVQWDKKSNTLSGESHVIGEDDYVVSLHVPTGYVLESATCDNGEISHKLGENNVAKVTIRTAENTDVAWQARFTKKQRHPSS